MKILKVLLRGYNGKSMSSRLRRWISFYSFFFFIALLDRSVYTRIGNWKRVFFAFSAITSSNLFETRDNGVGTIRSKENIVHLVHRRGHQTHYMFKIFLELVFNTIAFFFCNFFFFTIFSRYFAWLNESFNRSANQKWLTVFLFFVKNYGEKMFCFLRIF